MDSLKLVNSGTDRLVVVGNIFDGSADDGFGVTNGILAANIFTNIGDSYTTTCTPLPTKLDVDIVKN